MKKHFLSLILILISLSVPSALAEERILPRDSKIFIEDFPEDLDMYLKAEIVKKKVPLEIVTTREEAHYILRGTAEGDEDRKWHEGWLTAERDHVTAAVELVDQEGNFIWASEAGDRSWFFGPLKRGGSRKVAERLASNLKKIVSNSSRRPRLESKKTPEQAASPIPTPRIQPAQPVSAQPIEPEQVDSPYEAPAQPASPLPARAVESSSEAAMEGPSGAAEPVADTPVWQQIRTSAQEGDPAAQFLVGRRYAEGDGVPVNYAEAAKWFHLAAQKGHTEAQENLGVMYANGRGVTQDYAEAVLWYEKAAKSGNPEVQAELGDIYFFGRGGMKDHRRAKQWYEMAAVNGIPRAQFNLGLMYANGHGTSVDYVKAYTWLTAAAQFPILAEKAIEARQSFAGSMSAAQIAQAERDAQAYKR